VPGLPDLVLAVDHPDYVLYERQGVFLSRQGLDLGRIELTPACAVSGLVINHLGEPVDNALVSYELEIASVIRLSSSIRRQLEIARAVGALRTTTTNSDGRYRLRGLWPVRGQVVVKATGYAEAHSDWMEPVSDAELDELRICLGPGREMQGYVHDSSGRPIADATLICRPCRHFMTGRTGGTLGPAGPCVPSVRTDALGRFVFKNLALSHYDILAKAEGYSRSIMRKIEAGGARPLEITLLPTGSLSGRVHVAGSQDAVAGFVLEFERTDHEGFGDHDLSFADPLFQSTEKPGGFVLLHLEAGHYNVTARADGFSPTTIRTEALAKERISGVRIGLKPEATISGRILDDRTNLPVPGAAVRLLKTRPPDGRRILLVQPDEVEWAPREPDESVQTIHSNVNGHFELRSIAEGVYHLYIHHVNYAPVCTDDFRLHPGDRVESIRVRLCAGGTLQGSVFDMQEQPLMGETIRVRSRDTREFRFSTRTDSKGCYRLERLPAGPYWVFRVPGIPRARHTCAGM